MDTAKETLQKVTHPGKSSDEKKDKSGLERDMDPKPAKVHLEGSGSDNDAVAYCPSGKLKDKRALISGGDSGIGRSIAILFAMEGARVAIVYLQTEEEDAQHTREQVEKNGGEVLLIQSDLAQPANCKVVAEKVKDTFGGIDILVNNAATRIEHADICDISDEQWRATFSVNVDSYFFLTKYTLPYMSKGGVIINSASVDSYIGVPSRLDYATSKGAVIALTRSLSNQLVKKGIRVNAVAAGPVWTPMLETGVSDKGQKGHGLGNWTPMERLGQPVHVATSYVFLAAPESQFMSGQTLHPNGGIVVNG